MMPRWGLLLVLSFTLVIAGCTRDAGVQPFEPVPPSEDDSTPLPPTPTTIPITVQSQSEQTEEPEPTEPEPTDTEAAEEAPTETDIPPLVVTDTPTQRPSPTPRPTNTPVEEEEPEATDAMAETMTEDETAEPGFTPDLPDVFPSDTPVPTSTPLVTREPLVTPTQDGDEAVDAEGVPQAGDGCTYTVRAGDNAFRIAVNNNITLEELREANPSLAGSNPILQPGQELEIPGCGQGTRVVEQDTPEADEDTGTPSPEGFVEYTVQSGDTLLRIARQYNSTITDIVEANDLANPDRLSIGQVLLIPENSADQPDDE